MDISRLQELIAAVAASMSGVVAVGGLVAAFQSGLLKRLRFGNFEIEAGAREFGQARALIGAVARPQTEVPFETEQLAQYYSQVLAHSKISFWFSLVFASLGFVVIVIASFLYSPATTGATVAQIVAGVIMDAVSALFFVQSKNAQTAMGDFFDKLRRDRQQAESRKLCESISDVRARDALRIQLALHYAQVEKADEVSKSIIGTCLGRQDERAKENP